MDISSVTGAWTRYEDTTVRESSGDNLGKEDFLKLLVAQLTHQDPTNPVNDTEFISQLTAYSGLEQQMNMNKNLETLISINSATTAASAVSLIGTVVGYTGDDGTLQTGIVSFLDIVNGEVNLYLTDGRYIPFSSVEQVGKLASEASAGQTEASGAEQSDTGGDDGGDDGTEEAGTT
jgi:flagellar basal-body rod modification protein FlgD